MASGKERKRAKARQKHKVKRAAAQQARKRRTATTSASPSKAKGWPLGEAYLSENWDDWEATVHGVISRTNATGTSTFATLTVDLAEEGLTELKLYEGLPAQQIAAWAGTKAEDTAMFSADPAAVARLLRDGITLRKDKGSPDLPGQAKVLALFADVDPDESPFSYRLGYEDEQEITVEVKGGLGSKILGWFGRG